MYDKVIDESHLIFAEDCAKQLINQFTPTQQRNVILKVEELLRNHYQRRVEEASAVLNGSENAYKEFIG